MNAKKVFTSFFVIIFFLISSCTENKNYDNDENGKINKNGIENLKKRYQEIKILNQKLSKKKEDIDFTRKQLQSKIDKY